MIDLDKIPERFIGWSVKRGFYDQRVVAAEKLSRALQKAGLAHLIDIKGWIRYKPDRLVQGCIFNDAVWQAKLTRDSLKEAAALRAAARPGPRVRKRLKLASQPPGGR